MQQWRGPGSCSCDGLRRDNLRDYLQTKPPGVRRNKKTSIKAAPPRWRTWVIVKVAAIIFDRGEEMENLLAFGTEADFILSTSERVDMLEKRNAQLEAQLSDTNRQLGRSKDAHRKAARRLKEDRKLQRAADRTKLDERLAAAKERQKAAAEEAVRLVKESAMEVAEETVADRVKELATQVSVARQRARMVEGKASSAVRNLARAQDVEHELAAAKAKIDEYSLLAVEAKAVRDEYSEIAQLVKEMPTWQRVRGKGAGKGAKALEATYYECIWEQLANGTPLSAVPKNIVSVVRRAAPWLEPVEPTVEACRESRFALGTGEMAMLGRQVAEAFRVRQLGLDETTKFQDPSMVTSVLVQPTEGAPMQVVIFRAAYATGGGTAELLCKAVENKCFARLRGYLRGWQAECGAFRSTSGLDQIPSAAGCSGSAAAAASSQTRARLHGVCRTI